jgi:hypothetical protein
MARTRRILIPAGTIIAALGAFVALGMAMAKAAAG